MLKCPDFYLCADETAVPPPPLKKNVNFRIDPPPFGKTKKKLLVVYLKASLCPKIFEFS